MKQANLIYLLFYDKMMKFYCTLPNCKRSFDTERGGLFYHETRDPDHNPNKRCYEEPPSLLQDFLMAIKDEMIFQFHMKLV